MPKILSISGSLRARSSNSELLGAAALLAPAGMRVERYGDLGRLPHFNPDIEPLPAIVEALYRRVGEADGLLMSCPEYARGIPGAFKNMLDWLVGSTTFPDIPVVLFNASPRAGDAQAALRLVLTTMSARLVEEAFVALPLLARGLDAEAIAADPALAGPIQEALQAFAQALTPEKVT